MNIGSLSTIPRDVLPHIFCHFQDENLSVIEQTCTALHSYCKDYWEATLQKILILKRTDTHKGELIKIYRIYCNFLSKKFPECNHKEIKNIFEIKRKCETFVKTKNKDDYLRIFESMLEEAPSCTRLMIPGPEGLTLEFFAALKSIEHRPKITLFFLDSLKNHVHNSAILERAVYLKPYLVPPLIEAGVKANGTHYALAKSAEHSPGLLPLLLENGAIPIPRTLRTVVRYCPWQTQLVQNILKEQGIDDDTIQLAIEEGTRDRALDHDHLRDLFI